jgi:hypothetical protein
MSRSWPAVGIPDRYLDPTSVDTSPKVVQRLQIAGLLSMDALPPTLRLHGIQSMSAGCRLQDNWTPAVAVTLVDFELALSIGLAFPSTESLIPSIKKLTGS